MAFIYRASLSRKGISTDFVTASIILALSAAFVAGTQQNLPNKVVGEYQSNSSSQSALQRNEILKLRVCTPQNRSLELVYGTIKIPTFLTTESKFILEDYEIVKDFVLEVCPTGKEPDSSVVSIIPKDIYENLNLSDFLVTSKLKVFFQTLRNDSLLFDNGYLSVRDATQNIVQYYSHEEFCISSVNGDGSVDIRTCSFSSERPRLRKCCPLGMVIGEKHCVSQTHVDRWDPDYMDAKTWEMLSLDKVDPIYTYLKIPCTPPQREYWEVNDCTLDFHPVTDNTVAFTGADSNWKFFSSNVDWCMDRKLSTEEDGLKQMVKIMFHCVQNFNTKEQNDNETQRNYSWIYMISMYIGAAFHLLTTLVYLTTWKKQNLHGKTLCSCTASLFLMQTLLGNAHLLGIIKASSDSTLCFLNSVSAQFFMIAAFTWLLVVNYDMLKTFRSIRRESGSSSKRFLAYSAFGWLFPLMISVISICLDLTFTCRTSGVPVPDFGDYYCFVAPWAQGLYVYYILGILIFLSCILAGLTLFGLYKIKKATNMVDLRSTKRADEQQNFLLFLKLGVVMGLTWIFEVISWATTKENQNKIGWVILDLYNALSSILIFLIFVCKRATLTMLEQSIPSLSGVTVALSKFSSTFSGDSSFDNTASTSANGSSQKKYSIDSPAVVAVRYTKEKEEDNSGNTNRAFEQTTFK